MTVEEVSEKGSETKNGAVPRTGKPGLVKGRAGVVEMREVEIARVHAPEGFNVRLDFEEGAVEALSVSTAAVGLNEPIAVVPHPTVEGDYLVAAGFTRFASIKARKMRGTILVAVHRFVTPWGAALLNLTGNTSPRSLHPADLAKRLYELASGTYPTLDGTEPQAIPKKEICSAIGLGEQYVSNLIRVWKNLSDPIKAEWVSRRGKDKDGVSLHIPTDLVVAWAKEKPEDQLALFESWLSAQEAKKARRKAQDAGKKEGKKKVAEAAKAVPVTKTELRNKIASFQKRLYDKEGAVVLKGRELEIAEARIEALRWAAGEIKRLALT